MKSRRIRRRYRKPRKSMRGGTIPFILQDFMGSLQDGIQNTINQFSGNYTTNSSILS